jgi:hypothetical protein
MNARRALSLLLLAVASLEVTGYRFGIMNHSIQVPLLKHLMNPSLYRNDLVAGSFPLYASAFYPAVAPLARVLRSVEATYFGLFILTQFLSLSALYALSILAFGRPWGAILTCLLYLGGVASPGAETTTWTTLTHSSVTSALLLWNIYLYLKGWRLTAFAALGLLFNFHALYSFQVFILFLVDTLLSRTTLQTLLRSVGLFLLAALPAWVWLFRGEGVSSEAFPLWLQIMRERSSLVVFPSALPPAYYARYFLVLALGGLGFLALPRTPVHRSIGHFVVAIGLLVLTGLVFSEWCPLVPVIRAQLLRSGRWLSFMALLYAAELMADSWNWGFFARTAGALCFLGIFASQPSWLALGLAFYLLTSSARLGAAGVALGALALVFAAKTGAAPFDLSASLSALEEKLRLLENPPLVACLVSLAIMRALWEKPSILRELAAPLLALVVLSWALPILYMKHLAQIRSEPWNQVQLWVRTHTPEDAVILTPPQGEGFRVFSERAVVGEWKDGTLEFFSPSFAFEWFRRMQDLGGMTWAYDSFDADHLTALGRRYGARYAVCRKGRDLWPPLYKNDAFAVYELNLSPSP